ncbi:uncharacterized protein IUM83_15435 [Phytophthora cinnamomi]|uniref:uncharacterized protein n=1 Tax=Phytophthora cinnamomi TaxID=4785 RepID=UPI00355A0327|nr:hypothetical protein IUM83_15435 [Phytophthora cinnamomi]
MMALEAKLGSVAFEVEMDSVVLEVFEAKLGSVVGGAEPLLEVGRAEPRLEVDSVWLGALETEKEIFEGLLKQKRDRMEVNHTGVIGTTEEKTDEPPP